MIGLWHNTETNKIFHNRYILKIHTQFKCSNWISTKIRANSTKFPAQFSEQPIKTNFSDKVHRKCNEQINPRIFKNTFSF